MAITEAKLGYRVPGTLVVKKYFPALENVEEILFPTARSSRVSFREYHESLRLKGELTPAVEEAICKAAKIRRATRAVGYIAGGLTGVDEQTKKRYGMISVFIGDCGKVDGQRNLFFGYVPHLHGTDPVKHPNISPVEVRNIDHLWAVVIADFHINFLHPLAHGNAIELGWAEAHMIPTASQNLVGNKLSRLTLGMDNIAYRGEYEKNFNFDGLKQFKLFTDEYSAWLRTFPNKDPREFYYLSPKLLEGPTLRLNGYDPSGFNPIFDIGQYLAYVRDPGHPRYEQVGSILWHDWKESGMYVVKFGDGKIEDFYDGLMEKDKWGKCKLSFWLK